MPRILPATVLLMAGSVVFAGAPAVTSTITVTSTEPAEAGAAPGESSVVLLPGSYARPALSPAAAETRASSRVPPSVSLPEPPILPPPAVSTLARLAPRRTAEPLFAAPRPARPKLPGDFETDAALFLQKRLGVWLEDDSTRFFGPPARERDAIDGNKQPDGRILAFSDPSRRYREFELDFDANTGYLRTVFVYPWKMKWEDCRRMWGAEVNSSQTANGRWFHSYEHRRLDVLVDASGAVISLGLY